MEIKPIRNKLDYKQAIGYIDQLWNAPIGSKEADLFEIYALLIEDYQKRMGIEEFPDPIVSILFFMNERGFTIDNLSFLLESSNQAQALLNRQEELSTDVIWKLVNVWGMAPSSLIKPYQIDPSSHQTKQRN